MEVVVVVPSAVVVVVLALVVVVVVPVAVVVVVVVPDVWLQAIRNMPNRLEISKSNIILLRIDKLS